MFATEQSTLKTLAAMGFEDFMIEDGVLVISGIDRKYTEYLLSEKSDSPYPGLKEFVKIRASRNYCYSKTTSLDNIID